jgi:G3E family GTPase
VQANQATAATGHGPSDRVPTLLLFGADPSEKSRLLSGWMAERPSSERWALLRNGSILPVDGIGGDHPLGTSSGPGVSSDGLHISHLAGACACCLGGVAFTTALGRLLRQGPWDRLFIEVSAQAQGAALIDRIRSSALNDRLELLPSVLVLNQHEASFLDGLGESGYSLTNSVLKVKFHSL